MSRQGLKGELLSLPDLEPPKPQGSNLVFLASRRQRKRTHFHCSHRLFTVNMDHEDASLEATRALLSLSTASPAPSAPEFPVVSTPSTTTDPVVITQSSQPEDSFTTPAARFLSSPAAVVTRPSTESQLPVSTPAGAKVLPFSSPVIESPNRLNLRAVKRRLDDRATHACTQQLLADRAKRSKKTSATVHLHPTAVLSFVRHPFIDAILADSSIDLKAGTDPSVVARACHSNFNATWTWRASSGRGKPSRPSSPSGSITSKPAVGKKVNKLAKTWHNLVFPNVDWESDCLEQPPLSPFHRRLVLEDYLRLSVGDSVVALIHTDHPGFSSTWSPLLFSYYKRRPLAPISFKKRGIIYQYYSLPMTVVSHPERERLHNNGLSCDDFKYLMTEVGGGALVLGILGCEFAVQLKFGHFFEPHPATHFIQLWADSKHDSNFYRQLVKMTDPRRRSALLFRYYDELFGDARSIHALSLEYSKFLSQESVHMNLAAYKTGNISSSKIRTNFKLEKSDPDFESFRTLVDSVCLDRIKACYGRFNVLTGPILSQTDLVSLANAFKTKLPSMYSMLSIVLNYDDKKNHSRKAHLGTTWDRFVMYTFLSLMRIRNPHYFVPWALINAGASYGALSGSNANLSVYFGQRVTQKSMVRSLLPYSDSCKLSAKCNATLSASGAFGIGIWDNSQKGQQRKFQRNRKSAEVGKATTRVFVKPFWPSYYSTMVASITEAELLGFEAEQTPVTYIDQAVPSPYGMPAFETFAANHSIYAANLAPKFEQSVNYDGKRTAAYFRNIVTAAHIESQTRFIPFSLDSPFAFQDGRVVAANQSLGLTEQLRSSDTRDFYTEVKSYQNRIVTLWRERVPKAEVLVPTVSCEDETSAKGSGRVILSMLLLFGILRATDASGIDGDLSKIELVQGYKQRWIMMVGDGLSNIRLATFKDMIEASAYSFQGRHESSAMINSALGQVVNVSGDLHGGGFHFLAAIFAMFYGSLLQPIQVALGWKRIKGFDVAQCYQQAAGLATMVYDEVERHLYSAFTICLVESKELLEGWRSKASSSELAFYYAESFAEWCEEKLKTSTDEVLCLLLHFNKWMRVYRLFQRSVRCGDAITIEMLYNKFLPVFLATGKKHYFEIGMNSIEQYYRSIPFEILQMVRVNRTVPLYSGNNSHNQEMANWSMDGLIESLQRYYHLMDFENTVEGWTKHTGNILFMAKSLSHCQNEYSKAVIDMIDAGLADLAPVEDRKDSAQRRKVTIKPKRKQEHLLVSEILLLSKATMETERREYDRETFWGIMPSVTTELVDETEEERTQRWMAESRTRGEALVAELSDELFAAEDDNHENRTAVEAAVDWENIGGLDVEGAQDDVSNEMEDEGMEEGEDRRRRLKMLSDTVHLKVGKKSIGIVRRVAVNKIGFRDVEAEGIMEMHKRNYTVSRQRKVARIKRLQNALQASLINRDNGTSMTAAAMSRLKGTESTRLEPCYVVK